MYRWSFRFTYVEGINKTLVESFGFSGIYQKVEKNLN